MTATSVRDLPQPDAVIFDLDGTLVDTVETRINAWLQTFEEIGIPTSRDELVPLIGLDGKRLAREVAALRGRPIDAERSEVIDKRCGEIYEDLNRDPRPLPGVRRLFDTIDARKVDQGKSTNCLRIIVEQHFLPVERTLEQLPFFVARLSSEAKLKCPVQPVVPGGRRLLKDTHG